MKTSKWFQTFLILAVFLCFSKVKASEESCEVYGQYVAFKSGDSTEIGVCRSSIGGGLSYVNPFAADDLVRVLKVNRDNSAFVGALNSLGIGSDYSSALKAVVDYGGALTIKGDLNDLKSLEYITIQMNKAEGITEKIEATKKQKEIEKAERLARVSTPVFMDMAKFKDITAQNKNVASTLAEEKCRSMSSNSPEKNLQVMRVVFADGDESLVMPFEGKMVDSNTFEFSSPSSGSGLGGLQFAKSPFKPRQIRFQNGKTYWITDGKEFEVKTFYKSTSKEALGFGRPINSSTSYDTCFYAETLNGSSKKSSSLKSGGVK